MGRDVVAACGAALGWLFPDQVIVIDELVAVVEKQVRVGILNADAMTVFAFLTQLADERRESESPLRMTNVSTCPFV